MFNLEQAIAGWRRQMNAAGIKHQEDLDELEGHLRDEIGELMKSGRNAESAFGTAVQKMGQTGVLKAEYEKISTKNWNPNRPLPAAVVAMVCLPLLGFVAWLGSEVYLAGMMNLSQQVLAAGGLAMILALAFHRRRSVNVLPYVYTIAGIPGPPPAAGMNPFPPIPGFEPRWATYLKTALTIFPAAFLWLLNVVFVLPKLRELCQHAGTQLFVFTGSPLVQKALTLPVLGLELLSQNCLLVCVAMALGFGLLEWRSTAWPRYRRAVLGTGAFLLNASVLLAFGLMVISAILAATQAVHLK